MKIRCLKCNDIIKSEHAHDFQKCKCGACFIDGGNERTRLGGNLEDIAVINDDGTEEKLSLEKLKVLFNK